ncbi:hypothetical protein DM860_014365 [Cuscuta australis]|uniref:Anaphase-promoting complex subunit CDC26 n=1 Tax=Cuscuta australis TaxID=267555 RepID=A0A328DEA6_9ASTE|nr:hypothetical protein DM860_014365 [Cuscuta australis]
MLRRKPSKIEVQMEDKAELEKAPKTAAAAAAAGCTSSSTAAGATSLLEHFDRPAVDHPSKSQRIGLTS